MKNTRKSLGKIESKLLTTLSSQDQTVFSLEEAQDILGSSSGAIRRLLSDLVKKRWLIRLLPGKYLIVPLSAGEEGEYSENWYVIAKNLIEPAPYHIAYFSALDVHEMTTQPVMTVYISTPNKKRPKKIFGATFRFVYVPQTELWGVEDVWVTPNQKVKVSDLERTIIDCLDRPDLCGGISEVAKGVWTKRNNIDYQKLIEYVGRLQRKQKSVAKRLGFLLETYEIGSAETLSELKRFLSPGYTVLDPSLGPHGRFVSSWKVQVNVDPEELKEITKT